MIYLPVLGQTRIPKLTVWGWVSLIAAVGVYVFLLACAFQLALGDQGCTIAMGLLAGWCGSKTGMALAIAIIFIPPALIFSIKRPWLFPVAFYALLVPSDSYLNITSGSSVTKVAGAMAFLAIIFWIARKRRAVNPGVSTAMWIGYFVWATASLLWAVNVDVNVLTYYGTLAMLVVLYLGFVIVPVDEDEFKFMLAAFIIGSCIAAIFGAIIFSGGQYINQGRLKGHFDTEGNHLSSDYFAASMVFPIGAVVMAALRERWGFKKIMYLGAFAILMVGQYVVGSRGAIVADAATIGYFFWKNRYRAQLTFVTVCGLLVSFLYPNIWARFVAPDRSGADNGGSGRIPIWKVGLVAVKHYWLFGAGLDNFSTVYNKYFLTVWNTFYTNWNRGPHNIILEVIVELGVIGTIFLCLGWWYTFKAVDFIPKGHRLYDMRVMIEGGVFGTFVSALFVHIMHQKFTWWMFALVLAARTMASGVIRAEHSAVMVRDRAVPALPAVAPPQTLERVP